jgi:hypothetical protein
MKGTVMKSWGKFCLLGLWAFLPLRGLADGVCGKANSFAQGVAALEKKEYDKAIILFSDAIRTNPQHVSAYRKRESMGTS